MIRCVAFSPCRCKGRNKLDNLLPLINMKRSAPTTLFRAPDDLDPSALLSGVLNVYNFRSWWNAVSAVPIDCFEVRASLYVRALQYLPGSYKLWNNFLKEARAYCR